METHLVLSDGRRNFSVRDGSQKRQQGDAIVLDRTAAGANLRLVGVLAGPRANCLQCQGLGRTQPACPADDLVVSVNPIGLERSCLGAVDIARDWFDALAGRCASTTISRHGLAALVPNPGSIRC